MLSQIPFNLPIEFLPGLASGEILRYGAILKDAGTGRILGHLQESGIGQSVLSQALSGGASPLPLASAALKAGTDLYTSIQLHQIKAMMETLRALQVATLGVSLVGVGVSVAGFLYMRKRFNDLDGRVDSLIDAVNSGFQNLEKSNFRKQMSRTKALVQRAELAKSMIDASKEYREVAAQLADQSAFFEGEIAFQISETGPINHEKFWLLAQLWILCNNVRVDCQLRANELLNAQHVAERIASEYQGLFERIGPASFDEDHTKGRATIRTLRDVTDSASSKPFLLDFLRTQRIAGPDYIGALEREKQEAVLVLATA